MYIQLMNSTEDQKKKFVNTMGVIALCTVERKSVYQMAEELKMEAWQVDRNIDGLLYEFRKSLGWRRYLKALFRR